MDNVLGGHPLPGRRSRALRAVAGDEPRRPAARRRRSPASCCRSASEVVADDPHADAGRHGPAHRLRPAREAARAPAGAAAAASHHARKTADSVYRLEADAYCVDDLVIGGVFPLAMAVLKLAVMFVILVQLDASLALLSLAVVPFLYRLPSLLLGQDDRPRRAREGARIDADRAAATRSSRRSGASRASRGSGTSWRDSTRRAADTMEARLRLTWQESLFSVAVTRDHADRHGARAGRRRPARHGRHADGRRPARGHRLPGRRLQPAFVDRPYDRLAAAGDRQRRAACARSSR